MPARQIQFHYQHAHPGKRYDVLSLGTFEKDTMKGTISVLSLSIDFTGTRPGAVSSSISMGRFPVKALSTLAPCSYVPQFVGRSFARRHRNPAGRAAVILIQNATVLTVTKGTIEHGSVLIKDGRFPRAIEQARRT